MEAARSSVSTGTASSWRLVRLSTKPHCCASSAVSQPPVFINDSRSSTRFLHLRAYICATFQSIFSRSVFICASWSICACSWSALREAHWKNSAEHLCTRYIALLSIVICCAPIEAMVAALAFIPTKWAVTLPCSRNAAAIESAVASEPPKESISTVTGWSFCLARTRETRSASKSAPPTYPRK